MESRNEMIVMSILGVAITVANLVYWFRIVKNEDRFRRYIERRYGVTIARGGRGHWRVTSGRDSVFARFAIELWQLGYFMGAFVVWAIAISLCVGAMWLIDREFH